MKTYGLLAVCLVACLLVGVAEPRRSRGGSSRGSGKPSRGTSRRQPSAPPPAPASGSSLSHTGLASLSYPGYNSAPAKKISVPDTPKSHDTRPVGWNVNKETSVKKEVSSNAQSVPSSNAGSHSYPASGGQSGSSGSHAYPASGGLSGANGPPAGGQHSYPASNGVSGATGQQHSYPASGANSGAAGQQHGYPASGGISGAAGQPGYPASGGLSGSGTSNQQRPGQAPISAVNSYPVNNQNPHLANNQPYQGNTMGHGAQPPPYSAGGYGGAPGYGGHPGYGAPPAYNAPHGYGAPGYGAPPPYGSHGYGGMGGYGGGYGGGGFGGGYGNPLSAYGGYGQQKSSFLSGNKFGLILAGLAVWNLARSGSSTKHYHYYNNDDKKNMDPNGKMEPEAPVMDPILGELSNCTLTITNGNNTDVIAIPCIMASSFAPNAKPGDPSATRIDSSDGSSALNCTITVTTKNGTEIKTDIPCEELSKLAPKENVTAETPPPQGGIGLNCTANGGDPALNPCIPYPGTSINPEFPLEVIPLSSPSTTTVAEAIAQSTSTTVSPDSTSTTVTSESTTTTTTTTVEPPPMSAEATLKPSE